jgi:hypothetical protein
MSESVVDSRPFLPKPLCFVISLCLSVFAERQLKVIYDLFFGLMSRAHDRTFGWLGTSGLDLTSAAWAALWAVLSVVWIYELLKDRKSATPHVAIALLGACIGGIVGFWLDTPSLY